jgi:hypothetical protein
VPKQIPSRNDEMIERSKPEATLTQVKVFIGLRVYISRQVLESISETILLLVPIPSFLAAAMAANFFACLQ